MKNKKGFIPLLLSLPILIVLGILAVIFIISLFGFAFFLTKNVFLLLGIFMAVMGGIILIKGNSNIGFIAIGIGISLILLPMLFNGLNGQGFTLGAMVLE